MPEHSQLVSLRDTPPPAEWGVLVDHEAIADLATQWAGDAFPLPAFDYPGTPAHRDESWWFDYAVISVSVLACLWPPSGESMWRTELDDEWLDDAPGIFAVFTRAMSEDGLHLGELADMDDATGHALWAGQGTLQLIDERVDMVRAVARTIIERWDGSARNLVDQADRHAPSVVQALIDTMPGYLDRPVTEVGTLPFDKLAHLSTAIMAAGVGWADGGFTGFDDFPVYPDYMLPRVFRHFGVLTYDADLATAIDQQQLIPADSPGEHAVRWGTVYAGGALRAELAARGAEVSAPALDYRLWSEAVLGPDADAFGEHHRTITMAY